MLRILRVAPVPASPLLTSVALVASRYAGDGTKNGVFGSEQRTGKYSGDYLCLWSSLCSSFTRTANAIMASAVAICAPVRISFILFIFDKLLKYVGSV